MTGDLLLPVMVLKESALDNNLRVMAAYARARGFDLAPHGKTTMAPELFRRQLEAGAWAITVANVAQANVAFGAGAARVLVANEIVGTADAAWAVGAVRGGDHELLCLVDSVYGVGLLDNNLGRAGMSGRLGVLVEVGFRGGRSGVRSEHDVRGRGVRRRYRHRPLAREPGRRGQLFGRRPSHGRGPGRAGRFPN
ncbi:MAG: hypothetical protein ABSE77_03795 [Acidimicrobiales bacterium]